MARILSDMSTAKPGQRPHYQRILIIKPSSLGDIVHALPVLAALRAAYPQAHIAWLAGTTFAPLLDNHPLIDEVIPFDRRRYGRMLQSPRILAEFVHFLSFLRRRRFDLVVDLQGLIRSGFMAWVCGAAHRIGFASARELAGLFYTRRVRCRQTVHHAVDKNCCIAAALGLDSNPPTFPLGLRPRETQAARALLGEAGCEAATGFTAVLLGARWASKRWRADRLAELIDRMHADGQPPCVLLGAAGDRESADAVVSHCESGVMSLVGRTTLRELVALLDLAELVVSHDSGPMHIAAALNKPLVAIFGPTNPRRTGPYSPMARVVSLGVDCAPCYRRTCPLGHHACMQALETDQVLAQVRELRGHGTGSPV